MRKLPRSGHCFICGDKNECGTDMTWVQTSDGVQGSYRAAARHCGFEGIVHGGVLAGLLDDCSGWAVALRKGTFCYTGELKVRFLKPVTVGRDVLIRGRCAADAAAGKKYFLGVGEIVDGEGRVYATCAGTFFPLPPELAAAALEKLELPEAAAGGSVADYLWRGPAEE